MAHCITHSDSPLRGRSSALVLHTSAALCRVTIVLLALLVGARMVGADEAAPPSPQLQTQEDLERRVRQLEDEVRQLIAPGKFADASGRSAFRRVTAAEVIDQQPLAASGRNDDLTDPGFLKSVPLFGSRYRFSFGGYVKVDLLHDFSGTGDKQQFTLGTIPVDGSPPPGSYYNLQAAETRFNFEVRDTSSCAPHNRVFLEFDFFDETSPLSLRLRHAFFEYGNLLAGQTWTTLTEMRQLPFILDFAAGDAIYGGRTPQVRWQADVNKRLSWAVALEKFNDGAIFNAAGATGTARSNLPKLAGRVTREFSRSVVTVGAFVSQNRWDGTGSTPDKHTLGWGVVTGGRVYLGRGRRHWLGFGASYTDGGVQNIISLAEASTPNAVLGPDGMLRGVRAWNAQIGLQVHWTGRWSSNFSFAYAQLDGVPLGTPDDVMRVGHASHINLIYSVTERLRVGVEYMHGFQELVQRSSGTADRVQGSIIFDF